MNTGSNKKSFQPGNYHGCGSNIVVISGPSGSGKSTLIRRLIGCHPEMVFSTSHTTRPIRGKEVNGRDYHFVSKNTFQQMKDQDSFVEWADVYGNFYGTSYREIEEKLTDGNILVLDIDVQGAKNIKKKYPDGLFIFLVPPSLDELKKRLLRREKQMTDHIKFRLKIAAEEFKEYRFYDYIVVNDHIEDAFKVLEAVYISHMNRSFRHEGFMNEKLLKENLDALLSG